MNLVAKEFVASQVEQRGVLICSEFAGAAEELDNALLINPYDTESVADTLKQAIEMSAEEKAQRMARLQCTLPSTTSTSGSPISLPCSNASREQAMSQPWPLWRLLEAGLRCCMISEWCALYGSLFFYRVEDRDGTDP